MIPKVFSGTLSFAIFNHSDTMILRFILSASLCIDYFVCVCFFSLRTFSFFLYSQRTFVLFLLRLLFCCYVSCTVVVFSCYYFMAWKAEGVWKERYSVGNPPEAQRSLLSQITAASLGRTLQLSILLQLSPPCFLSVHTSYTTVAIQTL